MKILNLIPALALSGLMASTAMAAPNVIVGSDSVSVGGAADITLTFQADGVVAGLDFVISFDSTQFTATPACVSTLPTTGPDATVVCSVVGGNTVKVLVSAPFAFPVPTIVAGDQPLGSISFQSKGDTPATGYDLLITEENYFDINAAGVTPTQSTNGLITVNLGPQPDFTGTPAGLAMAAEQGPANPTGSLTVTNTGQTDSFLTGTCSLSGHSQISMSNGGFTDIEVGAAGSVVGVACNASAAGSYAATLSCSHNDSSTSPDEFAVTCDIAPPGAASYVSTPLPDATIEMTPGGDVPEDATVQDQVLTISNGATDTNDNDLVLSNCALTGGGDITVAGPGSTTLAPTAPPTLVTFSCSAATVAAHTGTYSCDFDTDGDESIDGTASYTVNCGVRAAASDLQESPLSGEPLSIFVPVFGSGQTSVKFTEILDEGVVAKINSCSFAPGSNFTVVTSLPVNVTAGGTETIVVQGTDPADGSVFVGDDLTCLYTDSDSDPGTASWPVTMTIQSAAIPTLSSWGLVLMILTMLGLGGIVIRRKTIS